MGARGRFCGGREGDNSETFSFLCQVCYIHNLCRTSNKHLSIALFGMSFKTCITLEFSYFLILRPLCSKLLKIS